MENFITNLLEIEELGKTRFLTVEEEKRLFEIYHNNIDFKEDINNILIKANEKLVHSIAKKYYPLVSLTKDDIYQLGLIGLSNAIKKFDCSRGVKFSTYASYWIKQSINKGMKKALESIEEPLYVKSIKKTFEKTKKQMEDDLKRNVSFNEVAIKMGFKGSELKIILYTSNPVDLDSYIDDENKIALHETLISDNETGFDKMTNEAIKLSIVNAISKLTEKEQNVIKMRYGFEDGLFHSFSEIASKMNLSKQRVQVLEKQAIAKMKKIL